MGEACAGATDTAPKDAVSDSAVDSGRGHEGVTSLTEVVVLVGLGYWDWSFDLLSGRNFKSQLACTPHLENLPRPAMGIAERRGMVVCCFWHSPRKKTEIANRNEIKICHLSDIDMCYSLVVGM